MKTLKILSILLVLSTVLNAQTLLNSHSSDGNFGYILKPADNYVVVGKSVSSAKAEELTKRVPHYIIETSYNNSVETSAYKTTFDYTGCDTTIDISATYDMYEFDLALFTGDTYLNFDINQHVDINPLDVFKIEPKFSNTVNTTTKEYITTYQNYGNQRYVKVNNDWVACSKVNKPFVYRATTNSGGIESFPDHRVFGYLDIYTFDENGNECLYGGSASRTLPSKGTTTLIFKNGDLSTFNYPLFDYSIFKNNYAAMPDGSPNYSVINSTTRVCYIKSEIIENVPCNGTTEFAAAQLPSNLTHTYSVKWTDANNVVFRQYDATVVGYYLVNGVKKYKYYRKYYELNTLTNTLECIRIDSDYAALEQLNNTTDYSDYHYYSTIDNEFLYGAYNSINDATTEGCSIWPMTTLDWLYTINNSNNMYEIKWSTVVMNADGISGTFKYFNDKSFFTNVSLVKHTESSGDGNHGSYIDYYRVFHYNGGGYTLDDNNNTTYNGDGSTTTDKIIKYYYYDEAKASSGNATAVEKNIGETVNITLTPNPVVDIMTITGIDSNVSVKVYDLNGKLVLSTITSRNVEMSNLTRGLYVVRVSDMNGKALVAEKILKK